MGKHECKEVNPSYGQTAKGKYEPANVLPMSQHRDCTDLGEGERKQSSISARGLNSGAHLDRHHAICAWVKDL